MHTRDGTLRVALGQMNATVGDLDGNASKIVGLIERAREEGAGLLVLPELALTGYPPEDLLLKRGFLGAAREVLDDVATAAEHAFVDAIRDAFDAEEIPALPPRGPR